MTYNSEWHAEDQQRIRTLDELYLIDKRDDKNHPQHSTYTGLWQKYNEKKDDEAA